LTPRQLVELIARRAQVQVVDAMIASGVPASELAAVQAGLFEEA